MKKIIDRRKLVILDPSLKDERGHHYILTKTLSQAASQEGLDVIWFVHKEFSRTLCSGDATVEPVFSLSMYEQFMQKKHEKTNGSSSKENRLFSALNSVYKKITNKLKMVVPVKYKPYLRDVFSKRDDASTFISELQNALARNEVQATDYVIAHTADGDLYRTILDLFAIPEFKKKAPTFHLSTPYDEGIMPGWNKGVAVDRVIDYMDIMGLLDSKIFLYAENELLAQHLSALLKVRVDTLNLPAIEGKDFKIIDENGTINIVYLGAAREEKGFLLLPEVVRLVHEDKVLKKLVRFTIQCSPQIIGYLPSIKLAIEKLEKFSDIAELLHTKLTTTEYYDILADADVVMLCYEHKKYKVRGSGIAVEAISMGKMILATPDTFPAYVAGDSALLVDEPIHILKAIKEITGNAQIFYKKSMERGVEYRQQNSGQSYIHKILSRVNDFALETRSPLDEQNRIDEQYRKNRAIAVLDKDIGQELTNMRCNWSDGDDQAAYLHRLVKVRQDE